MAGLTLLAHERTDLDEGDIERLHALVADWTLLADLALADLVLWLPTWNDAGFVAAAQVRATTALTVVPDDVVGSFTPRGRRQELDRALALGRPVLRRDATRPLAPAGVEALPVRHRDRVIGVVARHSSSAPRVAGRLEEMYLSTADDLIEMMADGAYPAATGLGATGAPPRVGDGLVRLNANGTVDYASPNAVSALRRLGLATDLVGADLGRLAVQLSHRPGPVDEALALVAGGRAAGEAEIENASATVSVAALPLRRGGRPVGALVLLRDVTELRRRERALLTKDATIREIHHRVKNNLQTVAALLRMQTRRLDDPGAREALDEAVRRVGAIAVVHETLAREPGDSVDFDQIADRLVALVADLATAHAGGTASPPRVVREGRFGSLPTDVATPVAMALSELLQNAVEHAGATTVRLRPSLDGDRLCVAVVDDGAGLPPDFDPDASGRLGLQIVRTLVTEDLGGALRLERPAGGGLRAVLEVPVR
ncbi:MAG: sensor histidine kinase [Candidatus Nanopelagicales bacterium]